MSLKMDNPRHIAEVALLEWGVDAVKSDPDEVNKFAKLVVALKETVAAEAQAEMVERCADYIDSSHDGIAASTANKIRSLSPSADWLERKLLKARIEEAKWWAEFEGGHDDPKTNKDCEKCQRLADMKSRLAALGK